MRRGSYGAWAVREDAFPRAGRREAQLAFLVRYAILAPSAHNTQPWRFVGEGNHLRLFAEDARALAVSDPSRRELTLSLGAALANLLVAANHFGFQATVEEFPSGSEGAVADVALVPDATARTPEADRLFAAIPRRHTNRFPFEPRRVPAEVLVHLRALASGSGAELSLVDDQGKIAALADLTRRAVVASMRPSAFRRELSQWVRKNATRAPDGMPGFAVGVPDVPSLLGPLMVRLPFTAAAEAKKRAAQVASSPLVAVIATVEDTPRAWVRAGMLLERLWLAATAAGLRVGVLAASIETDPFPAELQRLLGVSARPQAFLRIGYGPPDPHPTPRRPVDDVLTSSF